MKVSCSEGVANHTGPRVMSGSPQGDVESVVRGRCGQGLMLVSAVPCGTDFCGKFLFPGFPPGATFYRAFGTVRHLRRRSRACLLCEPRRSPRLCVEMILRMHHEGWKRTGGAP